MMTILEKIKKILIVAILSAVVINLIINHIKQHKAASENNIQKLIGDINSNDRTQYKIHSEIADIEINKITDDALQAIYLRYGSGLIGESEFIKELEEGVKRAKKVHQMSHEKCRSCADYIKESMILAKSGLIKQWEINMLDAKNRVAQAREEGKTEELKKKYLEVSASWFGEKHRCMEVKQEKDSSQEINNQTEDLTKSDMDVDEKR